MSVNPFQDKWSGLCVLDPGRINILPACLASLKGYSILLSGLFVYCKLHYDSVITLIQFSSWNICLQSKSSPFTEISLNEFYCIHCYHSLTPSNCLNNHLLNMEQVFELKEKNDLYFFNRSWYIFSSFALLTITWLEGCPWAQQCYCLVMPWTYVTVQSPGLKACIKYIFSSRLKGER